MGSIVEITIVTGWPIPTLLGVILTVTTGGVVSGWVESAKVRKTKAPRGSNARTVTLSAPCGAGGR
ncbi:MAG: hypothetical protein HY791_29405 [Deltaproteobacteria bacterium]|nr:hypothetical protein [Deltaproteobacteria bacterium]